MSGRTKEGLDNDRKQKRKVAQKEDALKKTTRTYQRPVIKRCSKKNKKRTKSNKTMRKRFFIKVDFQYKD